MKPLVNVEYENLKWKMFGNLDVIRIRTEMDGSCFFHSIAKSYFKPYITGKVDHKSLNRRNFIRRLREDLSKMLGARIDPQDSNSKTHYEILANGTLPEIAKEMTEYSLENMQKELDSSNSISNIYNEFISDQLDIDIYILDGEKKDVYMTGTDDNLLYKKRKSVVILYIPGKVGSGHYELVGLMHPDNYVETYFEHNDDIIKKIRSRMNKLRK